ncbi:hypothetical protein ACPJXG_14255 [Janthinobacterium sp. NFX145]|uniref:hypothetical protein n=1 Tax=unclassified Janthinobacterium TaxID=2610881 RepID=UPI0015959B32|nr:hypothetical protein [Janthinobacterium sp. BJB401]NVI84978.1 hypothetical protein [Janthinobacterium sp. BJB401]
MQYKADAAFILPLAHDGAELALALALEPATVAGICAAVTCDNAGSMVEVKTAKGASR